MKKLLTLGTFFLLTLSLTAQTKVGDKWVDNNLTFKVTDDFIKTKGEFYMCIEDQSREVCIENLSSGVEVKIYDQNNELLWEGIASGRRKGMKLPKAYSNAYYITIEAFKAYVVNKSTGNLIHQDEKIKIKHFVK